MSLPRERVTKSKVNGLNGFSAIVAAVVVDDKPRIEFRITARGLPERWADFTSRQVRELIRSLEVAVTAAEELTRHDGNFASSGARVAPAENEQDEHDASA